MSESINRSKKSKLLIIKSSSPFLSPRHVDLEGEGIVSLCFFVNAYRSQYHVVVNLIFKVFEKIVFVHTLHHSLCPDASTQSVDGTTLPPHPCPRPSGIVRLVDPTCSSNGHRRRERFPDDFSRGQRCSKAKRITFSSKQHDRSQIRPQQIPAEGGRLHVIFPPPHNETS